MWVSCSAVVIVCHYINNIIIIPRSPLTPRSARLTLSLIIIVIINLLFSLYAYGMWNIILSIIAQNNNYPIRGTRSWAWTPLRPSTGARWWTVCRATPPDQAANCWPARTRHWQWPLAWSFGRGTQSPIASSCTPPAGGHLPTTRRMCSTPKSVSLALFSPSLPERTI